MKSKNIDWLLIISIAITVICLLISGIVVYSNNNTLDELQATYDSNDKLIAELNDSINANDTVFNAGDESDAQSVEYVEPLLNSALNAGNALADIETNYVERLDSTDPQEPFSDITSKYLAEPEYFGWYDVPKSNVNYHWTFNTTYSFTESSVPVMWTCYSEDNIPLAFTMAEYRVNDEKFYNLEKLMTSEGRYYWNDFHNKSSDSGEDTTEIVTESENIDEDNDNSDVDEPVVTNAPNDGDSFSAETLDKYDKNDMDWLIGLMTGITDATTNAKSTVTTTTTVTALKKSN